MRPSNRIRRLAAVLLFAIAHAATVRADLRAGDLVVVFNSLSPGAAEIVAAYRTAHPELPDDALLDLADPALVDRPDLTHDEFVAQVRNPIREFLADAGRRAMPPRCLLLIRGLPHRVVDRTDPLAGDDPVAATTLFTRDGNATYASVDSELTLLWLDLDAGEAGGKMDSLSDNAVVNPYHTLMRGRHTFGPPAPRKAPSLVPIENVIWRTLDDDRRLTPADVLLVSRLDGHTAGDVIESLQRAQRLRINRGRVTVVLDENDPSLPADGNTELDDDALLPHRPDAPLHTGDDYEHAVALLSTAGWIVHYDATATFLDGAEIRRPIIAYASYGVNHGVDGSAVPDGDGLYVASLRFAPGAVFNTIESFNARAFNGLDTRYRQAQIADYLAVGGTFAVGHVAEPFSFAVADNEVLLDAFLNRGLTWAEAAWAAIPVLSWQHLVIGDPLARVERIDDLPADIDGDGDVDLADFTAFGSCFGTKPAHAGDACGSADVDADGDVDLADYAAVRDALSAAQ